MGIGMLSPYLAPVEEPEMTKMTNVYLKQDGNSHPDYRRDDAPWEQPFPFLLLNPAGARV